MASMHVGEEVVGGCAQGELLYADVGLSFWGGVDPVLGTVIDHSHPLHGVCLTGKVLAIPNGRGSCTGSQVMLELLLNDIAPAALLLRQPDAILALGVIVAEELFQQSIPIVSLGAEGFDAIRGSSSVAVKGRHVWSGTNSEEVASAAAAASSSVASSPDCLLAASGLQLTQEESEMLEGKRGNAATKLAMRILSRAAAVQGAASLLSITQAHIDGCTYIGPGGLRFAEKLADLGGQVAVPTTLNSNSVDRRQWRALGIDKAFGEAAQALGDAYVKMGCCDQSFTCAPYLLETSPAVGEQIAWGESNAVVFANSVLGARTQKYADYLDICAALTGRAPKAGAHIDAERHATVIVDASAVVKALAEGCADAFYPVLGYLCGLKSEARVPVVIGLEGLSISRDNLKAFAAAFGTTASVSMFHIAGVTPEATTLSEALGGQETAESLALSVADFKSAWTALDSGSGAAESAASDKIDLVALGNPHLSLDECRELASLVGGGGGEETLPKHPEVNVVVTLGRSVHSQASAAGYTKILEAFGAQFITDTCWCMLTEPVVPTTSETLITNSAKYAHYAPGLVNRKVRFSSLAGCIQAARTGTAPTRPSFRELGTARRGVSTLRPSSHFATIDFSARFLRVLLRRR
eukprot:TRINITY_DN111934_c0_g1_i1.p1 TRINITY_DN111934_c0_g1~~TRINITY_DN111934_c0_g1_i1.p1  ORF type:complete len:639 (-),score=84.44 TRINITY_DN111934_c0_g1_i1:434-2350(-)